MTRLISAAECQALGIGEALATADLEAVIDREEDELIKRFGTAATSRTETVDGGDGVVFLRRQISSVSAVTEAAQLGDTPDTLATTDYRIRALAGYITRLPEGLLWGREVNVTYTPIDDTNIRKTVLFDLVRIATEQAGWGDGSNVEGLGYKLTKGVATGAEWQAQRDAAYARMGGLVP